jgi:DNA polymerase (family 10)
MVNYPLQNGKRRGKDIFVEKYDYEFDWPGGAVAYTTISEVGLKLMERDELVRIFNDIAVLLELNGENPFKARAYSNAARIVENSDDLEERVQSGTIGAIPGLGAALSKKVAEWFKTGTIEYYEKLKTATPPGLLDLLKVPGLGAKKVNALYTNLGITTLEQLEEACEQDKLLELAGFGAKTQAKILAGIQFLKDHRGRYLWIEIAGEAGQIVERLRDHPSVLRAEIAGSLRRMIEVVKDIDLVAAAEDPAEIIKFFIGLPQVGAVISRGPTKASVSLKSGVNADLRVVLPREYPHALQHFTGSKEHNTALRHHAKALGYKVNEYGLFREEQPVYCGSEAEIYQHLKLSHIPPELREDRGELEAAQSGALPDLVKPDDLQGIFHVHTVYSDGVNTLREMVEAAIALGYSYLGISDHSRTAVYAHGLSEAALAEQFGEIEALNGEYPGFTIFKGIESDILPSGELDYPAAILAQFDFVIGSVHSQFQMEPTAMNQRILKAMDNPYLTMLGHPTGRILLQRPGYALDLEAVIAKAVQNEVIIEFNANPYRYDLDWRWCRKAKAAGVVIAINPDAHSIRELDLARSGLGVAAKGWLESGDVFNTGSAAEVRAYLQRRRNRKMFPQTGEGRL